MRADIALSRRNVLIVADPGVFLPTGKPTDVAEKLKSLGVSTVANTPEHMLAAQRRDTEKWGRVIKAANIKID